MQARRARLNSSTKTSSQVALAAQSGWVTARLDGLQASNLSSLANQPLILKLYQTSLEDSTMTEPRGGVNTYLLRPANTTMMAGMNTIVGRRKAGQKPTFFSSSVVAMADKEPMLIPYCA